MRFAHLLVLAAFLLAGCTRTSGRDFTIPIESQLELGRTTITDVTTMFGEPDTTQSYTSSGGSAIPKQPESEFDSATATVPGAYEALRYRFVKASDPLAGGDIFVKSAVFTFRDGILIGYNSVSNFTDHPTNFEETKISLFRKGLSTRQDAEAVLGPPSGQAIYPIALQPGQYKLQYDYSTADPHSHKAFNKELVLLFGGDGRLMDYRSTSSVSNLPPAPAVTPVPIIIPTHK